MSDVFESLFDFSPMAEYLVFPLCFILVFGILSLIRRFFK